LIVVARKEKNKQSFNIIILFFLNVTHKGRKYLTDNLNTFFIALHIFLARF